MGEDNLTPAMKQYMDVKNEHPDCIVMFRMGDFYEMFYQDAKTAAHELDITLTTRGKGEKQAPLAGIPFHSIQPYIGKLVQKGYKVCMVEQLEDPKKAKGIVKRGVVRIITPGTVIDETILNEKSNNYIMAIDKEDDIIGLALCDVSTGEFFVINTSLPKLENEMNKYTPSEVILPMSLEQSDFAKSMEQYFVNYLDDLHFFNEKALQTIKDHFSSPPSLTKLATQSAGGLLSYLTQTQKNSLEHITSIKIINSDDAMLLDKETLQNLNIVSNHKNDKATLLSVIDKTKTSMGSRLMKNWLVKPLLNKEKILDRLDAVEELKDNLILKEQITEELSGMNDMERLITRIIFKTASPKDLVALRNSLQKLPKLNNLLKQTKSKLLNKELNELQDITTLLQNAIKDEPNTSIREGNIIKQGYNLDLDQLRNTKKDSHKWLAEFEASEKEKTGIKFLKVKYNRVFGYFIEVSKSNIDLVPDHYTRKQTQANSERYITPELKEKENIILTADEKAHEIEYELFMSLLETIAKETISIQETAKEVARIDCLQSLTTTAMTSKYKRPTIDDSEHITIQGGRHPIVEQLEERFISNDLHLTDTKMMIITGPNMAGKSVYIKQNALIIILAQMGSFVPAESATIGIVDRIFSRVGASDDIASGHSTFMVEMSETANILQNATHKSFIILDEIGRGTSTYDGVSLAWAIAEYIITKIKAKTLFATHYHHLNKMSTEYDGIKNFNIAVSEKEDKIIFLRKIIEGGTDKSYGIQVAKLAGVPMEVIESSKRIITQLEMEDEIGDMIHKNLKTKKSISEEEKKNLQKTLLDM